MKALLILAACLAAAPFGAPAMALGRAAPPHAVAPRPPGHHGHFGRAEIGLGWIGDTAPEAAPALSPTEADAPLLAAEVSAARFCPAEAPVATRSAGPRIIYIGHRPAAPANAPKVIYGTD